jgi:GTPase SAR1 family protein
LPKPTNFSKTFVNTPKHVAKILVATKIDLADQRKVSNEEAKQMANQDGIPYIETSAKNDINVVEAVNTLACAAEKAMEVEESFQCILPPQPRTPPTNPNPNRWRCVIM